MPIIYDDQQTTRRSGAPFIASRYNATDMYMSHFANSLMLSFMALNGNFQEKGQAVKELAICERKMKYWSNQSNFDHDEMLLRCKKEKQKWK